MKITQKPVAVLGEENDGNTRGSTVPGMRRREFLSRGGALAVSLGLGASLPTFAREVKLSTPTAEKLGWRASVQHFTYRRFGLFEALDKAAATRHASHRNPQ